MGLFGSDEDEREEVTIGISEEDDETDENKTDTSPEVGTVDFGGSESSQEDESSNLRNEVSSLDSVKEAEVSSQSSNSTSSSASNSRSKNSDIEAIKKQNQKIIEKLDKVLSKL